MSTIAPVSAPKAEHTELDGWSPPESPGPAPEPTGLSDPRVNKVLLYGAGAVLFYLFQQYFWPAPIGVEIQGIVIGGLTAMVAFGIALIYRANRIINFAQGDLGGVPASVAILLIVGKGWPYPLAMGAGLVLALALGAVVEYVIIRRFTKAPRLILTVVTIGVGTLLTIFEVAMPRVFGIQSPPQNFKSPFSFKFRINPMVFNGNSVVAVLAVLITIAGLAAFFRYTNIGIAVRGCAESAERAALLGIPVRRINTIVWVLATVLATVGLVLRAGVVGLPLGSALGLPILVRALAAAVVGRMEKFPTIFVAAIGIGILEQSIVWHTGKGLLIDPILCVVIIGALLFQRRGKLSRLGDVASSAWTAATEVRPIPDELKSLAEVRFAKWGLLGILGLIVAVLPAVLGEARTTLAATVFIYGIVAVSVVVLTGWAGQVSLGQFAFVGVGEVAGSWMTLHWHLDLVLVLLLAGAIGALAAILIGIPALRIQGLFLAVVTLSVALGARSWLLNRDYMKWIPEPFVRIPRLPLLGHIPLDSETHYYYFCLTALVFAIVGVRNLRRGRTGRAIIGIRDNAKGAQAFGVNAIRAKLTAFAVSGFLASAAGVLLVHLQQNLLSSNYDPQHSVEVFSMTVIGGLGSVPGALLGAAFIQGVAYFHNSLPAAIRPLAVLFASSVGLIVVLAFLPGGLGSLMYLVRDRYLRRVADRRGIIVPSLIADVREDSVYAPAPDEPAPWVVRTGEPEAPVDITVATAADEALLADALAALETDEPPTEVVELVDAAATPRTRTRRTRS
jgi:branched-chain amino acid transport system permease protein